MADRLAHRDLRNNSADVLRRVAAGQSFEVTNHGEVVAVISPPGSRPSFRVREARVRGGFAHLKRVSRDRTTQEILDDLRSER